MQVYLNVPRLGNKAYPLVPNILQGLTGPQEYDWNNWAGGPAQVDGTEVASYFTGLHGLEVDNDDWAGDVVILAGGAYAIRPLFGMVGPDRMTGGRYQVAFLPIAPGEFGLPTMEYLDVPKGLADARNYYGQVDGVRLLNWTLPMLYRYDDVDRSWPANIGKNASECWVPVHLRADLENVVSKGWGMVEIHNELWNNAPPDWAETQALYGMDRFPTSGWHDYTSQQRQEFLNTRDALLREQGETALRLAKMGQRVVIGGQTTGDAMYTTALAHQQMPDEMHENLNYALGAYVGHGRNMREALEQPDVGVFALQEAAERDIEEMAATWRECAASLADRYGRPVPMHIYEGGIHVPNAGAAGGADPRHLELFAELDDTGMLEMMQASLLDAARDAGMESFALFEGPKPFEQPGQRGELDYWTIDEHHDGENLGEILALHKNSQNVADEAQLLRELIEAHGAHLRAYCEAASKVVQATAPAAGHYLAVSLQNVVEEIDLVAEAPRES